MKKERKLLKLIILSTILLSQTRADYYGLIYGRPEGGKDWKLHVCINYNPAVEILRTQLKYDVRGLLKDFSKDYGCYDSKSYNESSVAGYIVGVAKGNCTFAEKANMAEKHKANGVIVVTDHFVVRVNQTPDTGRFNITIGTMIKSDYNELKALGKSVELMMYHPREEDKFDPCIVILFFLAVVCIAVGGYWSGLSAIDRLKRVEEKQERKSKKAGYVQLPDSERDEDESDSEEDEDKNENMPFVVFTCVWLTLLYIFKDYLAFVLIRLYYLAGGIGLFYCLLPLWNYIPWRTRVPHIPCCKHPPKIKDLVLYALCAAVPVVLVVDGHASYAWVLQDILSFALCINVLETIHLANLKICSIILVLSLLFEMIFVFTTPYFTENPGGIPVMVDEATGGSGKSTEWLPMVFIVPKLNSSPYSVCYVTYSMWGLDYVVVPGWLIGYNHGIDLQVNSKKIYYIATVIAYGIGMIITFVASEMMKPSLPALLYLVPCTLLTTFVIACCRGETKILWNGIRRQVSENAANPKSPTEAEKMNLLP